MNMIRLNLRIIYVGNYQVSCIMANNFCIHYLSKCSRVILKETSCRVILSLHFHETLFIFICHNRVICDRRNRDVNTGGSSIETIQYGTECNSGHRAIQPNSQSWRFRIDARERRCPSFQDDSLVVYDKSTFYILNEARNSWRAMTWSTSIPMLSRYLFYPLPKKKGKKLYKCKNILFY